MKRENSMVIRSIGSELLICKNCGQRVSRINQEICEGCGITLSKDEVKKYGEMQLDLGSVVEIYRDSEEYLDPDPELQVTFEEEDYLDFDSELEICDNFKEYLDLDAILADTFEFREDLKHIDGDEKEKRTLEKHVDKLHTLQELYG